MSRGWTRNLLLGLNLVMSTFLLPSFLFAEKASTPNRFVSPEKQPQAFDQEGKCPQSLLPKISVKKLFELLELEKLLEIINIQMEKNVKLERKQLVDFAKVGQEAFMDFTCPENFSQITNNPEKLAQRLGFESMDQLVHAQPGSALVIKQVGLDKLKGFENGNSPDDLMPFARQIIFPLNDPLTGAARSSLTFTLFRKTNEWRWTRRGASNRIKTIQKFRKTEKELVVIPGLNLSFLAVRSEGPLGLIPLYDMTFEKVQLKAGQALSANEVFTGLASEAKKILNIPSTPTEQQPQRKLLR